MWVVWLLPVFATLGASVSHAGARTGLRIERRWHPNGQLAEEREWRGSHEDGVHRGWWPDGHPRFAYTYQNGLLQGESREWFASGALWRDQQYDAGHESGLQRMYWEDGRVRASFVVQNGRRFGLLGAKGCVTRGGTATSVSP